MPIRYTRVGWQDAPSVDTPIDAANLNHMDNGILALSEEVDTELPLIQERLSAVEGSDSEIEDIKTRLTAVEGGVRSHVGQIIMSTTLDTMEKVVAMYGGTSWVKIRGRFLLGESTIYPINSTGGSANAIIPNHTHRVDYNDYKSSGSVTTVYNGNFSSSQVLSGVITNNTSRHVTTNPPTNAESVNGANMPPYKAVYIWERMA